MKIKKYRKLADLTQQELADRVGVTVPTVKKWETTLTNEDARRTPRLGTLKKVAKVLGVTVNDLL